MQLETKMHCCAVTEETTVVFKAWVVWQEVQSAKLLHKMQFAMHCVQTLTPKTVSGK